MRALWIFLALWCGTAQAQTVSPGAFGINLGFPLTTVPKVFASACRLWNASGLQGSPAATDVSWLAVEQTSGVYTWTQLDAQVAKCKANGQQIIYTFGAVPGWANGSTGAWEPPTSFATLYAFQTAVVTRYAGDGIWWDTWNEANQAGIWWSGTQAQMILIASNLYTVVHSLDPSGKVLTPSMTGWGGTMFAWVQSYMALGGGSYADVMNIHCYPSEGSAYGSTPATTTPEAIWNQLKQFQAIYAFYGQGSKPLVCDEGSYTTIARTGFTPFQAGAYAAEWLLFNASSGMETSAWYSYDDSVWGTLWNGGSWLDTAGVAYRVMQSWLAGSTFSANAARIANTNQVRNTTGTGMVAGTPGTPPTDWSVNNPDTGHGITTSFVGTCAAGSGVEWNVAGTATAGASGYAQLSFETGNHIAATTGSLQTFGLAVSLISGSVVPSDATFVMELNENNSGGSYLDNVLYYIFIPFVGFSQAQGTQAFGTNATNAAVAYVQPNFTVTYSVGDTLNVSVCLSAPSVDSGTEWSATTSAGQIVWDANGGPTAYSTSYTHVMDLTGQQAAVQGGSVTLTNLPVFLSNSAREGWAP